MKESGRRMNRYIVIMADTADYLLKDGECQRKDGRYSYAYTDRFKKRHTVYAKTLVELREKEKEIRMDLDMEIDPNAANTADNSANMIHIYLKPPHLYFIPTIKISK